MREVTFRYLESVVRDHSRPMIGLVINEGLQYGSSWKDVESITDPEFRMLTFSPSDFAKVATTLADDGYTVFRLGAPPASPLGVKHEHVVDYATSAQQSSLLDVALPGMMTHVVSTQTGPDSVALLFGKSVTYVDVARPKYSFFDVRFAHWQPAILESSTGRRLGLLELLSTDLVDMKTPEDFVRSGVRVIRSTLADRIVTAKEGIEFSRGAIVLTDFDRELQSQARALFNEARKLGRLRNRGNPSALLSPHFLRQHADWYLSE